MCKSKVYLSVITLDYSTFIINQFVPLTKDK